MIVMALTNPVAFVLSFGVFAAFDYGYRWTGRGEPSDAMNLAVILGAYVLSMRFLPWWVRPIQLYRWWRQK